MSPIVIKQVRHGSIIDGTVYIRIVFHSRYFIALQHHKWFLPPLFIFVSFQLKECSSRTRHLSLNLYDGFVKY